MKTHTKTLLYLAVLAALDVVIPVPITAGILFYVVLNKPEWFRNLVSEIYPS